MTAGSAGIQARASHPVPPQRGKLPLLWAECPHSAACGLRSPASRSEGTSPAYLRARNRRQNLPANVRITNFCQRISPACSVPDPANVRNTNIRRAGSRFGLLDLSNTPWIGARKLLFGPFDLAG